MHAILQAHPATPRFRSTRARRALPPVDARLYQSLPASSQARHLEILWALSVSMLFTQAEPHCGFVGKSLASSACFPCFAPPPPWSVGSAHIAPARGRPVLTQWSFVASGFVASRAFFSGGGWYGVDRLRPQQTLSGLFSTLMSSWLAEMEKNNYACPSHSRMRGCVRSPFQTPPLSHLILGLCWARITKSLIEAQAGGEGAAQAGCGGGVCSRNAGL